MPKSQLQDTGERMIPKAHYGTIMYGEHIGRYEAVVKLVEGKIVLDVASGSGYGSYELAKKAKKVIGVDVSEEAIKYSKSNYKGVNLDFIKSDGLRIPLDDKSIEVIISMETIEHIEDDNNFISELHRVLKPGGLVVISTPNDKAYPKGNHFHYREYDKKTLVNLVQSKFKNIKVYYQTIDLAASIISDDQIDSEYSESNITVSRFSKRSIEDCVYFMVVASDNKIPKDAINRNVILSELFSHLEEQKKVKEINDLRERLSSKRYLFIDKVLSTLYFWKK